jgi:hypothetical protein
MNRFCTHMLVIFHYIVVLPTIRIGNGPRACRTPVACFELSSLSVMVGLFSPSPSYKLEFIVHALLFQPEIKLRCVLPRRLPILRVKTLGA